MLYDKTDTTVKGENVQQNSVTSGDPSSTVVSMRRGALMGLLELLRLLRCGNSGLGGSQHDGCHSFEQLSTSACMSP